MAKAKIKIVQWMIEQIRGRIHGVRGDGAMNAEGRE